MEEKTHHFLKNEILSHERNIFISSILITSIGYFAISFFLNSIRANANIIILWILIIIQFTLYFSIFYLSYKRSKIIGWTWFAFPLFILLAVLGRVEDLEIILIPFVVIIMIILSFRTKNIPDNMKGIFK